MPTGRRPARRSAYAPTVQSAVNRVRESQNLRTTHTARGRAQSAGDDDPGVTASAMSSFPSPMSEAGCSFLRRLGGRCIRSVSSSIRDMKSLAAQQCYVAIGNVGGACEELGDSDKLVGGEWVRDRCDVSREW